MCVQTVSIMVVTEVKIVKRSVINGRFQSLSWKIRWKKETKYEKVMDISKGI